MFGSRLIQHVQHVLSHRATQDTLWRGIDFACVSLRGLALAIAAARALGPAQWGVLGATFAVFALGRPIANLALGAKMPALIGRGQLNHQQAAGLLDELLLKIRAESCFEAAAAPLESCPGPI